LPAECQQKYSEELKRFMESEETVVEFPPSLSGLERKCVHQVQLPIDQNV
jgi:hypothetical protein